MLYNVTGAGHSVCVCVCVCVCVGGCGVRGGGGVWGVWGAGGSELRGAWCKSGEGGQGREGVQLPDSLVDEAVFQSVGPRLETAQSPP